MTHETASLSQQYQDQLLLISKKYQNFLISAEDADAIQGRDLFVESHGENPDTLLRLNEIYLNIVGQMMPFFESFENLNQERGDEIVDLTNGTYRTRLWATEIC